MDPPMMPMIPVIFAVAVIKALILGKLSYICINICMCHDLINCPFLLKCLLDKMKKEESKYHNYPPPPHHYGYDRHNVLLRKRKF